MTKLDIDIKAKKILKSVGLYKTKNHIEVLRVLLRATGPLSRKNILRNMSGPKSDKVTVYRTLEIFCRKGVVHKAFLDKRAWNFELAHHCSDIQCHPHFTCSSCGKTQCLYDVNMPIAKGLEKGYVIERQQIKLEGLCPNCSQ